jgi:hypothetical protein
MLARKLRPCSLARLNPSLRRTEVGEVRGNQPAAHVR